MSHLTVTGSFELPLQNLSLSESSGEKGVTFFFNLFSRDKRNKKDPARAHWCRAMLHVPHDEADRWRTNLIPGAAFLVTAATLNGRINDKGFPNNILMLNRFETHKMSPGTIPQGD